MGAPKPTQSLSLKTREIKVVTPHAGDGADYQHPAHPDFENPIDAVYHVHSRNGYLKFATKDGVVGVQPQTTNEFTKIAISPACPIAKIEVWYNGTIIGIKF